METNDQKLHFADGQLFTTFHDRPEATVATVEDMAARIYRTLTAEQIAYCRAPERGEFRGFAALHDLCDANTLLPFAKDEAFWSAWIPAALDTVLAFWNATMDAVSAKIIAGERKQIKEGKRTLYAYPVVCEGLTFCDWYGNNDEAREGIRAELEAQGYKVRKVTVDFISTVELE